MPTLYIDTETRSKLNIKDCGAWRYAADPSTQPLYLCYAVDDDEVATWRPSDPVPTPFCEAARGFADWNVIAHQYDFERFICQLVLTTRYGFPSIPFTSWHCSMRLALANAYPAELGLLSQALDLPHRKDPKALRALRAVSRPRKDGSWDEDPAKLALVHERCVLDVITMRAVWRHLKLRHLSESERYLQLLDAEINRRGVRVDRAFVEAARALASNERNAVNVRLSELTDGAITSIDQVQKLRAAVNARGHAMTTLGKRSVAATLAHDPDDHTRQLLELRRDGARASVKKFNKILAYAGDDDRLRGTLQMYGSATGRWSSPGPQLHNLKRNERSLPLSVVDAVRNGDRAHVAQFGNPLAMLGDISPAMLCAASGHVLMSADLRMIESRVLAWVASDERKLAIHRNYDHTGDKNLEPYRVLASLMLGKSVKEITDNERQQGKFAELAAGFGGGVGAWKRIFDDPRPDREIERDKVKWRLMHPKICRFWHRLFKAVCVAVKLKTAVRVDEPPAPSIVCSFEDGNLYITLPSGRSITYPNARLGQVRGA
jgi:DNA polymerase